MKVETHTAAVAMACCSAAYMSDVKPAGWTRMSPDPWGYRPSAAALKGGATGVGRQRLAGVSAGTAAEGAGMGADAAPAAADAAAGAGLASGTMPMP